VLLAIGKGPPKKTPNGDPRGAGGWVRGQKRTRVRFIFSMFFYRVLDFL
jgi:hypothetical protein